MKSLFITRFIINPAIILFIGIIQIQAQTTKTVKVGSTAENISEPQKEIIENIVRDYLLKNPSIIREAMQALQIREAKEKQERTADNIKALEKEIFSSPDTPTAGNSKGDVSIAVFFDYNCGYCKKSLPALKELLAKDPSIRIVYKELPILSPQSQFAARAALAAHRQGKYIEFHEALIETVEISEEVIKSISDRLGLDYLTLQKDMNDPKINESINNNHLLANALEINGTPAYIVGEQIIPGAVDSDALAKIVSTERAKLAKTTKTKNNLAAKQPIQ